MLNKCFQKFLAISVLIKGKGLAKRVREVNKHDKFKDLHKSCGNQAIETFILLT